MVRDGVGGTVKQLVGNSGLKANHNKCILRPKQLYEWGTKNIKGIFFFNVFSETVRENFLLKYDLDNRYSLTNHFFNWDSLHARLNSHYETCSYKKENQKRVKGYSKSV